MYMSDLHTCISAPHACLATEEIGRRHWILWNWSYGWLWPPCGFWESKLRFSGRTASVLNSWAISLALIYFFKSLKYFSVWLCTQEMKSKDLRYLHRKKKRYLYSCVHWLFIHISQKVEITQMSTIGCEVGKCGLATYTWWPPPPAQFLLFICTTTRTSLDVWLREVCGFGKPRPHQVDPGDTLGPSSLLFCSPATDDPIRQYLHNASFFDSYSVAGIWILFLSRGHSTWNSLVWGPFCKTLISFSLVSSCLRSTRPLRVSQHKDQWEENRQPNMEVSKRPVSSQKKSSNQLPVTRKYKLNPNMDYHKPITTRQKMEPSNHHHHHHSPSRQLSKYRQNSGPVHELGVSVWDPEVPCLTLSLGPGWPNVPVSSLVIKSGDQQVSAPC